MSINRFALPASCYKPLPELRPKPFNQQEFQEALRKGLRDLDDPYSPERIQAHRDLRAAGIA